MKKAMVVRSWVAWACALWAFCWGSAASAARTAQGGPQYQIVSYQRDFPGAGLVRTTLTVQDGPVELNRFRVVRLERADCGRPADPPVMLLSPFGFPVEYWQIPDDGGVSSGFAPQLALAGYDVWLVDSRLAAAAPGSCESGEVDCSPLADWGMQTAVEDALFVRTLVRMAHPSVKPVIGGLSGGSSTALATANARPQQFSGLFLWEGTLLSLDPATRARNAAFCQADLAAIASGMHYDGSVQGFQTIFELATVAPTQSTPIPVFPPGTSNLGALLFALTQPDPNNPLNFTDTFVRFVGDPFTETLAYSNLERVLALGPLIGSYAPMAFIRDSHCSMAGLDTSFVDRLDKFPGRVLVYAEGMGFNQMMLDTAGALENADVTVDYQPTFGESDRYFHDDWQQLALAPLVAWLDETRQRHGPHGRWSGDGQAYDQGPQHGHGPGRGHAQGHEPGQVHNQRVRHR